MTNKRKRQALGKGLGALIPGGDDAAEQGEMLLARIEEIFPNPEQPRRTFDHNTLKELTASIKQKGILQPILVNRVPGGYELVAGERRLRAARLAGLERIPVLVKRLRDDKLELALTENVQRENLNPVEEAQAYRELQEQYGLTQEEIARRIGKDRATVANSLRLLGLPEAVKAELLKGTISAGHARALLALGDERAIHNMMNRIVRKGLSVREVERLVNETRGSRPSRVQPQKVSPEVQELERRLERHLGSRTRVLQMKRGGRIEIAYGSLDELNGIVDRIMKD